MTQTGTPRGLESCASSLSLDILICEVGLRKANSRGERTGQCRPGAQREPGQGGPETESSLKWLPLVVPLGKVTLCWSWEFSSAPRAGSLLSSFSRPSENEGYSGPHVEASSSPKLGNEVF